MLFIEEYVAEDNKFDDEKLYISPHKQSIFQRYDSNIEKDNKVYGNVLISGYHYRNDFKLQYSMNNHTFSTNIE